VVQQILHGIQATVGTGQIVSARLLAQVEPVDAEPVEADPVEAEEETPTAA
jgi:hypothetical protein